MNHLKLSAFIKSVEDETNPYIFKGSQTRFDLFDGLCQNFFTYLKIDERKKYIHLLKRIIKRPIKHIKNNVNNTVFESVLTRLNVRQKLCFLKPGRV